MGLFIYWQYYLEKRIDDNSSVYSIFMPPPLMRISLWTRANGRLAAVMIIGFTIWCGFVSYLYWIQVWVVLIFIQYCLTRENIALLSKLQKIYSHTECHPYHAHLRLWPIIQCFYRIYGVAYTACLASRSV